ncbi:MAG TPA: delta-60 repeat domain-containing protein, partial [Nocardioidaceae bacterium]|nr:delta-60 repeat domain-containing protein [Nocardioidaceae bacterium]
MPRIRVHRGAALGAAALLLLTACASDGDTSSPTAARESRNGEASLEVPPFDTVRTVPLSTSEHDRLLGAAFDAENRLYGAGWVAQGADQLMAVARFRADGQLDESFGTKGVASVNVAQGGKA